VREEKGPAKNFNPATSSQIESRSTPTPDAGATIDAKASSGVDQSTPELKSIGPYRLLKKLGEGGMGQVWLAEQTGPVRRQVALKLIRTGMYDASAALRFQSERQSLAVMNHPAIAKVFDAGSTTDGQPYFVMEYVDGPSITRYCDSKNMRIAERLELFIKMCEGVQHAHQKAIIHRDLKPSNVLVVEVDGKPVPRIIDFGIAKVISSQPSAEQTMFTRMGALVGTPGFMSPEQADPNVLDVDTRTDVYSLGVILYVLLTGMLPFDPEQSRRKAFDEVLCQLREEDPPKPSTKLSREKGAATVAAERRGTEPGELVALLRGDLDWITTKALERDRARRYGTPSELASDIWRYLKHELVVARPASAAYRLQRYVRRHRAAVGIAAGLVLLLAGFAVVQAVQLRRITRERDRANRITEFMTGMFKVSDPDESRGNSVTAREILDNASKDIERGLAKDPELQSQLMDVMAKVYNSLGLYPQAESLLTRAVDIRRRVLGPENQDTLNSRTSLAWALRQQGRYPEAEKLQRETLEIERRVRGLQHPETLNAMSQLAWTQEREGHYPDAEKLQRKTLEIERRVLGPENPETLNTMNDLAAALHAQGHFTESEGLNRQTLEIRRRLLGPDHTSTLDSMINLASDLHSEGRYAEAEKLDREALDIDRRVLGPEHPETLGSMSNLADDLNSEAHYAEAEKLDRETVEIERRVLGPENPQTLNAMSNLADALHSQGHDAEAEKLYRETIDVQRRVLGPEHPDTLKSTHSLAAILVHEGHYAEAEKLERQTLEIQRRVLGQENPDTALTAYYLACALAREGKTEQALAFLREGVDHGLQPAALLELERSDDLKSIHGDPRFAAIVSDAQRRAAGLRDLK
jgi:non-specific serine/threonine protein kinase/serine/threonine-protein kinase